MNNLEKRIREHYDPKDHPSVFELLFSLEAMQKMARGSDIQKMRLTEKNARLRAEIMEAPHDESCEGWEVLRATDGTEVVFDHMNETNCDCWKRTALENPNDSR